MYTFMLDFEEAFDTTTHEIYKRKLISYGAGGRHSTQPLMNSIKGKLFSNGVGGIPSIQPHTNSEKVNSSAME